MHGAYALPDLRGASILIVDDFVVDRGVADRADLVRWIRGYDREHQRLTAVIALTRWGLEYPCEAARAAGFDGYFVKPVTTDDLVVGLAALLRTPRKPR